MLTIILGIIASFAVGFGIAIFFDSANSVTAAAMIITCGVIISLVAGLHEPLSGYTDWEMVQETELVSLSDSTASGGVGLIYVSLSADNAYTYRYEIDSEFGTETSKEYQTATVLGQNVQEVEDPDCETPVIRVYTRKGKMSVWTFALGNEETKYVFYVPEGTISKEVKLN